MAVTAVNRKSARFAAICISVVAVASFLVLPVFVGAAAADIGLTEREVGFLASAIMTGSALSSILAVTWIRRVNWVVAGRGSLVLLLAAHGASLLVDDFHWFVLCQCLAGLGGGAAYSLALTALSDSEHPDRFFGLSVAAQVSFQVIGMLFFPYIVALYGLDGMLVVFVCMTFGALVLLHWFPGSGTDTSHVSIGSALLKPRVLAALTGCLFFFFNVGALWTYIERMAVAAGFTPEFIGNGLALGVALGVPGALLASWCGDRFGRVGPLALGAAGTMIALYLLRTGMSSNDYLLGIALYNLCWNFSLAFQYAAVNAVDSSGRSVAAAPAFHGAGGALGPGIAALFVSTGSFAAVNLLSGAAVALSFVLFALAIVVRAKG